MRSSCAKGACKLRIRRLQRRSICLRGGCILPNLVFWPCSGLSASPSASQAAPCLSREATKLTKLAKRGTATEVQAAMPVRPFPTPRSPRARRFRRHRSLSSPPLHRGALETAPAAGTAAPVVAMETDASHATAPRPAPPPPPAGKPRARGRSDEAGPSNVDSMDHDGEHRGGLSEEAPEKRRRAIARDAPPGAAQVARARAAALPPDAWTDAHVHARTHAQLAADCAVGQAADESAAAAQIEYSASAAQQPTAQVWPLSARRCARPAHAHAHARPAFDPATAAARP